MNVLAMMLSENHKTEPLLSCSSSCSSVKGGGLAQVGRRIDTRGFIPPLEVIATRFPVTRIASVLSLLRTIKDDATFESWAVLLDAHDRGMLDGDQKIEASHRC
jgi:hypothetical protein